MKNIKKFSLLLSFLLLVSFALSFSVFAEDNVKSIEDNDKIFTYIPKEYELAVYASNILSYQDKEGNTLAFCVGENKFAPNGITTLDEGKIQVVFEFFYLYEQDLERLNECTVLYKKTEKAKVNGYSCYYLEGEYFYEGDDPDGLFVYCFNAFVFATKEDIVVAAYEDVERTTENKEALMPVLENIVLNGTHFKNDTPEKNGEHDFTNSPPFNEVVTAAQETYYNDLFGNDTVVTTIAVTIALFCIVPTVVLFIVAIALIIKYNRLRKTLKQCELTYGTLSQYNGYPQNYSGYGYNYNQPVNQPYQPPVNPAYQQNSVNQNVSQTPSYVTNAVNNLENVQPAQPAQPNLPPEMQENENNNENKI